VLKRIPARDFAPRSSSETKKNMVLPYRMCIAGGWMDQPWVSEVHPGSVVVVGLAPFREFNDRSGMATSSRKKARELWGDVFPPGDRERTAKMLFACENPPGTAYVSGSQDAIGLVYPGVNRLDYSGKYWPHHIESCNDPEIIAWLQSVIRFVPLAPRPDHYNPLLKKDLSVANVKLLGEAGYRCYDAILRKDLSGLGAALNDTLEGWRRILPLTVNAEIEARIAEYRGHAGAIFSGCGGGYIIVASDKPVRDGFPVIIRQPEF
jgi:hypothetical protein